MRVKTALKILFWRRIPVLSPSTKPAAVPAMYRYIWERPRLSSGTEAVSQARGKREYLTGLYITCSLPVPTFSAFLAINSPPSHDTPYPHVPPISTRGTYPREGFANRSWAVQISRKTRAWTWTGRNYRGTRRSKEQ